MVVSDPHWPVQFEQFLASCKLSFEDNWVNSLHVFLSEDFCFDLCQELVFHIFMCDNTSMGESIVSH